MDFEFIFSDNRFQPHICDIVDDIFEDKLKYKLPYLFDKSFNNKLPGAIEAYLLNHDKTNKIFGLFDKRIEKETREKLASITNEDPYQNAVFGPFMTNLEKRCNDTLEQTKQDSANELSSIRSGQNFLIGSVGLLGAYAVGATWYLFNNQKRNS